MSSNAYKLAFAAALLGAWFGLVLIGKVPPDGFIAAVTGALSGLGVYHVNSSKSSTPEPKAQNEV